MRVYRCVSLSEMHSRSGTTKRHKTKMKDYCVYILKCADKSYYTGITSQIEKRIVEHQTGKYPNCYTFNRRPVELVYMQQFTQVNEAIKHEKQLKGWSRKKKEALISGNYEELVRLSNTKKLSH